MKISRMSMQLTCAFAVATAGSAFFACSSSSTNGAGGGGSPTTGTTSTGTTTTTTGTTSATTGTASATTGTTSAVTGTTTTSAATGTTTTSSSSGSTSSSGGTDGGTDGSADGGGPNVNYTFDTTTQGWVINNFAAAGNVDTIDGGVPPTLTWDSTVGNPSPGSLKLTATFTAYNQTVDAILNFPAAVDLTGKIVHAKVMTTSGTFTGFAVVHGSSTSAFVYQNGTFNAPSLGTWKDFVFDLSTATATGWDSTKVEQIGVQFGTGSPQGDAAVTFDTPQAVVFQIDTVTD